jgi:hypothetical protein
VEELDKREYLPSSMHFFSKKEGRHSCLPHPANSGTQPPNGYFFGIRMMIKAGHVCIFACVALATVFTGCSRPPSKAGTPTFAMSDEQAKEIALAAVRDVSQRKDVVWRADAVSRRPDGACDILVLRVPEVAGGHRLVALSADGKVTFIAKGK